MLGLLLFAWVIIPLPLTLPNIADASVQQETTRPARHILKADKIWQLQTDDNSRFDASGLALTAKGELITLSDRGPELYKILVTTNPAARLMRTGILTTAQLNQLPQAGHSRYDTEGVSVDEQGNFYICEESRRWVVRYSPGTKTVRRLEIDFTPVKKYFSADPNASFEGIAVGKGKLYLANERQEARIIVVDLSSLKVLADFAVHPSWFAFGGPHYSDLCFFEGHLFILDRNHRAVLEVNPDTHQLLAEFSFGEMEQAPEVVYKTNFPTGTMEGLAVDEKFFWLVTDNNGLPRMKYPRDIRPTLFRCPRPQ